MEVWKDIEGYEGLYQVSNLGRVKSLERNVVYSGQTRHVKERIMKQTEKKGGRCEQGYLQICLKKNNVVKNFRVHRLVANAFIQNPEGKETVNHIDGNKHNNCVDNLEWLTQEENNKHAYTTGLNGKGHRVRGKCAICIAQYDKNMNLIDKYPSMSEAARQTGIDKRYISRGVRNGWKYGGFIWKKVQNAE